MLKPRVKHIGKFTGIAIVLFVMIGFVGKKYDDVTCQSILVDIDNLRGNYFISDEEIVSIITDNGNRRVVGEPFANLDFKTLEHEIEQEKFVRNAEVFRDLKGNLIVSINQSRPIARLMGNRLSDRYISDQGDVLPVSKRYTARVMLIRGPFAEDSSMKHLYDSELGNEMFDLLKYIEQDDFWKAQVAELYVTKSGDISMYTQVSKQEVIFGKPEDIDKKFKRLKIFYKHILPARGWNTYSKVNVKFKDQIVCE